MSKEWKLVPVEPTDEMKEAGAPSCEYTGTVCAALCYEAMIAAAPNHIGDATGMVAPVVDHQPVRNASEVAYNLQAELQAAKRDAHNSEVAYKAAIEKQDELRATIEQQAAEIERIKKISDNYCALGMDANQEIFRLRSQLADAAQSLETISLQAGRDEFMKDMTQIRGYANSRARVAQGALSDSVEPAAPQRKPATPNQCTSCDNCRGFITGHDSSEQKPYSICCENCGKKARAHEHAELAEAWNEINPRTDATVSAEPTNKESAQ